MEGEGRREEWREREGGRRREEREGGKGVREGGKGGRKKFMLCFLTFVGDTEDVGTEHLGD